MPRRSGRPKCGPPVPRRSRVFVNGQEVLARESYHQSFDRDMLRRAVHLRNGRNTILVKVCQNDQPEAWAQNWMFQLRFTDDLGRGDPRQAIVTRGSPMNGSRGCRLWALVVSVAIASRSVTGRSSAGPTWRASRPIPVPAGALGARENLRWKAALARPWRVVAGGLGDHVLSPPVRPESDADARLCSSPSTQGTNSGSGSFGRPARRTVIPKTCMAAPTPVAAATASTPFWPRRPGLPRYRRQRPLDPHAGQIDHPAMSNLSVAGRRRFCTTTC